MTAMFHSLERRFAAFTQAYRFQPGEALQQFTA
jgi:hypothetical protein